MTGDAMEHVPAHSISVCNTIMASQTHPHSQPDVLSSEVTQTHVTMDEERLDPGEEDEPAPQAKFTDDKASDEQPQKTSVMIKGQDLT